MSVGQDDNPLPRLPRAGRGRARPRGFAAARPDLVTIDVPLSLPPGRARIHDRDGAHFRPCDIELRRRGIPFFPVTLGPMRGLTERGLRLKAALEERGFPAVEIYPGGAQDVWGLPRAKRGPDRS